MSGRAIGVPVPATLMMAALMLVLPGSAWADSTLEIDITWAGGAKTKEVSLDDAVRPPEAEEYLELRLPIDVTVVYRGGACAPGANVTLNFVLHRTTFITWAAVGFPVNSTAVVTVPAGAYSQGTPPLKTRSPGFLFSAHKPPPNFSYSFEVSAFGEIHGCLPEPSGIPAAEPITVTIRNATAVATTQTPSPMATTPGFATSAGTLLVASLLALGLRAAETRRSRRP